MEMIVLRTKKELDIYMNPQRQKLLRQMALAARPMTPKELSVRMGISPSSIQYHIGKLMELGLIELDHTEQIRGITARYYVAAKRTVSIGIDHKDQLQGEKEVLTQKLVADVLDGCLQEVRKGALADRGDVQTGMIYLTKEEGTELLEGIREYAAAHSAAGPQKSPWEFCSILYQAGLKE